jgi:hypothetical protein
MISNVKRKMEISHITSNLCSFLLRLSPLEHSFMALGGEPRIFGAMSRKTMLQKSSSLEPSPNGDRSIVINRLSSLFNLFHWVNKKRLVTRHSFAVSGDFHLHKKIELGQTRLSSNTIQMSHYLANTSNRSHSPQTGRSGGKTKP